MSEDFAALLRELKERSGLSYGVLARRLHMSTSTLHRYCNGDAVPAEYAPVERLARLCKASPRELVELHRRWVLADAGRGQRRAAPGQVPREGEAAAERVPEVVPEVVPEAVSEAVPNVVPEAVSEAVPDAAAEVVPDQGTPEVATEPSGQPFRRRRAALLAGALGVVAAVALAVSLPSGGHGAPGATDARGPVGVASSDGGQRASAHASASLPPSASGSPEERQRKQEKQGEKGKGGTGSSAGSAADPSASPRSAPPRRGESASAPVPLTVTTRPYAWESPCSQHYLIDRPPGEVPPPPVELEAPAWVASQRAVSAGEQYVTLTVQGTGRETVVVEDLTVRVVGRGAPLPWNDYAMGVGCGGDVPTRPFTIALDAARPAVKAAAGGRDFPFKVSESDPEVFHVTADASAYDVRWYLELTWSSGSRGGTLLIGDGDKPFRTSGNNGRPAYDFPLGGSGWGEAMVDADAGADVGG
ncbi:helix-turn-helix domain-containing protein [Streptomyces sp. NPDC052687]|uniref:helix-turn-helix domain-containing protein n=1 Tax=Streptomyces sp. NPDC052687 TaxID=3154759 RepID=UPI00342ECA1F